MGRSPTFSRGIEKLLCRKIVHERFVTNFTEQQAHAPARHLIILWTSLHQSARVGASMKLQLISGAIVAYTILAMAWICYAGLGATP
jgi:hypothetical protein